MAGHRFVELAARPCKDEPWIRVAGAYLRLVFVCRSQEERAPSPGTAAFVWLDQTRTPRRWVEQARSPEISEARGTLRRRFCRMWTRNSSAKRIGRSRQKTAKSEARIPQFLNAESFQVPVCSRLSVGVLRPLGCRTPASIERLWKCAKQGKAVAELYMSTWDTGAVWRILECVRGPRRANGSQEQSSIGHDLAILRPRYMYPFHGCIPQPCLNVFGFELTAR